MQNKSTGNVTKNSEKCQQMLDRADRAAFWLGFLGVICFAFFAMVSAGIAYTIYLTYNGHGYGHQIQAILPKWFISPIAGCTLFALGKWIKSYSSFQAQQSLTQMEILSRIVEKDKTPTNQ